MMPIRVTCIIFSVLILHAVPRSTTSSSLQGLNESIVNETIANNLLNMSQVMNEGDHCLLICVKSLSVQQTWLQFRNLTETGIARMFNVSWFRRQCSAYQELKSCIRACPNGPFKKRISDWMYPMSYICQESSFMRYVECYQLAYAEEDCQEECMDERQNFLRLLQIAKSNFTPNDYIRLTEDGLNLTCKYINCGNHYHLETLFAKCGLEALLTLRTALRYLVASLKNFNEYIFTLVYGVNSRKFVFLNECD